MQPTKVTERIKTKALELLEQYPGGLRYSELHSKILATDSSFKPNTINGCIWNLDATFPEREMKKLLRHSRVGGNDGICVTNYVKINNPRKGKIMRSIVSLIAASAFVTTTSLALLLVPAGALAEEAHMGRAHNMMDRRISLGLSPEMRQHQLSNMRAHLAAIQKITGLLAEKKYDKAAKIAHSQLGLTEEMKKMCDMFENEEFKTLGLAFHNSGDELGDALKAKNLKKSLRALNKTLGYCVQCHEKFQQ